MFGALVNTGMKFSFSQKRGTLCGLRVYNPRGASKASSGMPLSVIKTSSQYISPLVKISTHIFQNLIQVYFTICNCNLLTGLFSKYFMYIAM